MGWPFSATLSLACDALLCKLLLLRARRSNWLMTRALLYYYARVIGGLVYVNASADRIDLASRTQLQER